VVFEPGRFGVETDVMGTAALVDVAMCVRAEVFVTMRSSIGKLAKIYRTFEGKETEMVECE